APCRGATCAEPKSRAAPMSSGWTSKSPPPKCDGSTSAGRAKGDRCVAGSNVHIGSSGLPGGLILGAKDSPDTQSHWRDGRAERCGCAADGGVLLFVVWQRLGGVLGAVPARRS